VFCNALLEAGIPIYICEGCAEKIEYYNNRINSLNLPGDIETYCDGVVCVGRYSDALKNSLKRFKFSNKPSYYRAFGKLLALKIENTMQIDRLDMVVPVPLHRNRQKERGYNQSRLIAECASKYLKVQFVSNILVKTTESESQSILNRDQRLSNVEGVFKVINEENIYKKNILIVDDIITTGSTINQCSKVLKQAGADGVFAGVIATTRNK
jgi:ComF family protein